MKRISVIFLFLLLLVSCEYEYGLRTDFYTVETGEAINITYCTAELKGRMIANDAPESDYLHYGMIVSTTQDLSETKGQKHQAVNADDLGNFVTKVTALDSNTTYYYCAFVLYKGKYYYGPVQKFKTEE